MAKYERAGAAGGEPLDGDEPSEDTEPASVLLGLLNARGNEMVEMVENVGDGSRLNSQDGVSKETMPLSISLDLIMVLNEILTAAGSSVQTSCSILSSFSFLA